MCRGVDAHESKRRTLLPGCHIAHAGGRCARVASEMRRSAFMKTTIGVLACALIALAGCGGGSSEVQDAQTVAPGLRGPHGMGPRGMGGPMMGRMACPYMLEGAHVAVENTLSGVAMTFTTDRPADVADLRGRVAAMGMRHGQRSAMGAPMRMPPATTSVTDVPNGARIEFTATDPNDAQALQQHASTMAEDVRGRRGCPMMPDVPA